MSSFSGLCFVLTTRVFSELLLGLVISLCRRSVNTVLVSYRSPLHPTPCISFLDTSVCFFTSPNPTEAHNSPRSFNDWSHHLRSNTIGPLMVAQQLLKLSPQLPIHTLVFMSSDSGSAANFRAFEDGFAAYAASKAALNQGLRVRASPFSSYTINSLPIPSISLFPLVSFQITKAHTSQSS